MPPPNTPERSDTANPLSTASVHGIPHPSTWAAVAPQNGPSPMEGNTLMLPYRQTPVPLVPSRSLIRRSPPQRQTREFEPRPRSPNEPTIDFRNLEYVSSVDENLVCPICRVALITPITTSCEHVFCQDCFMESHRNSPTCPIDRCSLRLPQDIGPTHRLILNQLDALEVKCPNSSSGCTKVLARSMIMHHVDKYCGFAWMDCPDKSCNGKVYKKDVESGCLHYDTICPDCAETLQQIDMERHRRSECLERKTHCEKCNMEILRCREDEHEMECQEAEASCKWSMYGCLHKARRKELVDHAPYCDFRVMGPVVDSLKEEITRLRQEVQFLNEKDKAKERRIKFLESDRASSTTALGYPLDISSLPGGSSAPVEYAPFDSRDQYLLSLLESQETKVDQMSAGMTELEAKQTMMLFNETIPIKEQLAELRSAQGVLGMHVRWLMNFRLQERRPTVGAAGPSSGPSHEPRPGGGGSGGPEFPPMRRSSDTMRGEPITKL